MLIAALAVILSGAAAWWSHRYARSLTDERRALEAERKTANKRLENASQEKKEYESLEGMVAAVAEAVKWEPDSTYVLRWFADTAAERGVRLVNSQMLALRRGSDNAGSAAYKRTQFSLRLQGSYGRLVEYVDRVERSPHAMVIEKMAMSATRNAGNMGEIMLTISCLYPAPAKAGAAERGGKGQ